MSSVELSALLQHRTYLRKLWSRQYSDDGASSSATGSVVDLRNANTDVNKLSASDVLKCQSCQHDNAKWFKRCMNCGASLVCGIQIPVDGGPQPMEGMTGESTGGEPAQKGYKRAHRDEGDRKEI